MTTILSFFAMVIVFAISVAIVLWGAKTGTRARALAFLAAIAFGILGFHFTGGLKVADPDWFPRASTDPDASNLPDAGCQDLVEKLRRAGVISVPAHRKINIRQNMWDKLPPSAQAVAAACLQKVLKLDDETVRPFRPAGDADSAE